MDVLYGVRMTGPLAPHSGKEGAFRNLLGLLTPELEHVELDTDAGRRTLARYFVQRKRADVRQYLTREDGALDDSLAGEHRIPRRPVVQGRDLQAVAGLPGAARRRDRLRQRAGHRGGPAGQAGGRASPGGRRSRCCAPGLLAARRRADPADPVGSRRGRAPPEEADRLGAPVTRGLRRRRRAGGHRRRARRRRRARSTAGARRVSPSWPSAPAQLEGPDEDRKLAALIKHLKELLDDGYNPIVFCRYIPTAEYVAEHLDGKLGRKTVVAAVTGTLSPQQRLERIEELAERAADDRAPAACWWPPTACRRASTCSTTSTPSSTTTWRGTRPGTSSARAASTGSASARRRPGRHHLRQATTASTARSSKS